MYKLIIINKSGNNETLDICQDVATASLCLAYAYRSGVDHVELWDDEIWLYNIAAPIER